MNMNPASLARLKKPLLLTTIGLFGISALLGIFFIIGSPQGDSWRILASTTLFAFFSLFSMNNIMRLTSEPLARVFALIGIVSNLVWGSLWFMSIWSLLGSSSYGFVWKTIWIASVLSICVTLTSNYLAMKNTSNALIGFKLTALGAAWFLYIYITPAVLGSDGEYLAATWQIVAIASIVFAFSVISTPILYRIQSGKLQDEPVAAPYQEQNNDELRAQIEAELRPRIEAEMRLKIEAEMQQDQTKTQL